MTDNKNRTASDMRIATNKKGGSIGSPGSVAYNFERKGVIQITKDQGSEDTLFMQATEAGAEDFDITDDMYMVITAPEQLFETKEKIEEQGVTCAETSLEMIPKVSVECSEEDQKANMELIDFLEALDDVDVVFHNMG